MDRHEFDYIVSSSDEVMAGTGHVRLTILQALGRLEDEDQIREVATVICDKKMLSKKATAFVRRCRGINPVFDLIELGQQVADLVEQYCDTHSGWSYGLILSALESVMETVSLLKREQDDQTNE